MSKAFTPIGIVLGLLSGLVARRIFAFIWCKVDRLGCFGSLLISVVVLTLVLLLILGVL